MRGLARFAGYLVAVLAYTIAVAGLVVAGGFLFGYGFDAGARASQDYFTWKQGEEK